MMKAIRDLVAVIPPPATPRIVLSKEAWLDVFARLGTRLPEDFVQFHATFGDGYFYSVSHRMSANLSVYCGIASELGGMVHNRLSELRLAKERRPKSVPHPLYWEPGGLLPWGRTTNDTDLCWSVRGDLVDNWRVVAVRPASGETEEYDMCMAEFLTCIIGGTRQSKLMPKGFPGEKGVAFEAWPFNG